MTPLVMDLQEIADLNVNLVTHPVPQHLDSVLNNLRTTLIETPELFLAQGSSLTEGRQAGSKQDFVGVGVADT